MNYFSELVSQSLSRATESSLSVLGITNPNLRNHLQAQMHRECGAKGSFLAQPLFEHTFGWTQAKPLMKDLVTEGLLSRPVLMSLDKDKVTDKNGKKITNRYQFKSTFHPYVHQLESWNTLLSKDVKSIVVTSGTGSGKTECFMVPVLEDLHREQKIKKEKLCGVRAIFLYPLNALINSQRERLNAWTQDFEGDIRFCLYNGNTEEKENKVRAKQSLLPNEILSRELMRREPAPILVTNGTMLEYMLIRNVDAPIISKSKEEKSLRWIILDEAHTYVGSQAAELSMQLRRVLQAFGVEAKDVRFVATSATIAGEDAEEQLQNYLAELAGVSINQVVVIGGERAIPKLHYSETKELKRNEITNISPDALAGSKDFDPDISSNRFDALKQSVIARSIREKFVNSEKPLKLNELVIYLEGEFPSEKFTQNEVLHWIDLLTGTKKDKDSEAFLKVRAHFFQGMLNGLWSCIDPKCAIKEKSELKKSWPFGNVYASQRSRCECNAPVCEIGFCNDCNEPHLLALEKNSVITQRETAVSDEFSLLIDNDSEDSEDEQVKSASKKRYTSPLTLRAASEQNGNYVKVGINKSTGLIGGLDEEVNLYVLQDYENECGNCGFSGYSKATPIRRAMLGSPFFVANVVPTLLEFCPDPKVDKETGLGPQSLPGRGRKLITFTDSRQGTARMAVRMQQEAERNKLRGLVFKILQKNQNEVPTEETVSKDADIDALRVQVQSLLAAGLKDMAETLQEKIEQAETGSTNIKPAVLK